MLHKTFRATSWLLAFLVVAALAGALSTAGADNATATPNATPPVNTILQKTSTQLAQTKTLHFKLEIQGDTFIDGGNQMQLLAAEGDLERPDKVSTTFKAKVLKAATVSVKLITIGDKSWWTNLVSGKWEPAPKDLGYNPAILFNNQGGIGPVMGKLQNPKLVGTETVNGNESYHIQGTVPAKVIDPLTANTMKGDPITVDLWVNEKTYDLDRIRLTEPKTKDNQHPAIWTLDLTKQNEKVKIEAPS